MQDLGILAIAVVLVQMALSKWIYPLFNAATEQLFSITQQTAITSPTLGNKIIGFLAGIIPFELGNFSNWIAMFLGAFVILMIGYWVYEQKWAWKGKNIYQRLWAILLYGTAVLYVFLLITKISVVSTLALPLLIGLGINYFILAFVIATLAKQGTFKFLRI
jgi:hypothetical protein